MSKKPNNLKLGLLLIFIPTILWVVIEQTAQVNWLSNLAVQLRVQWFAFLLFVAFLAVLKRKKYLLTSVVLLLFINSYYFFQTSFIDSVTQAPSNKEYLKIFVMNVLTKNKSFQEVEKYIIKENPDLVFLIEVNQEWRERLKNLHQKYPRRHWETREDNFGMAFLAKKTDFIGFDVEYFSKYKLPFINVWFNSDNTNILYTCIHTLPPMNKEYFNIQNKMIEKAIKGSFDHFPSEHRVILGDFNTTIWGKSFQKTALENSGFRDGFSKFTQKINPTWRMLPFYLGGLKIDHILVSPMIVLKDLRLGPYLGSDHRGLITEVSIKN